MVKQIFFVVQQKTLLITIGSTVIEGLTYRAPTTTTTSGQVAAQAYLGSGYRLTNNYTYDANGNITAVKTTTNENGISVEKTTNYTYDTANQLIREDNQAANKTWTWEYDDAGNILYRKEYAYTTGTLGSVVSTDTYTYGHNQWGDLLTAYNGAATGYDSIGNMGNNRGWTYTWTHGRELATISDGNITWMNTYNADGIRTKRVSSNGTTYNYVYNGSSLSQMTVGGNTLNFAYDASGSPMAVVYNGAVYYYITNLQGDVVAILDSAKNAVVEYTYDAWGRILTTSGSMATTLGVHNPLRYRGYVYDSETQLYYLQSRYYDPQLGRFINADAFASTGQGLLGNNMFAYCNNNPVLFADATGHALFPCTVFINDGNGKISDPPDTENNEALETLSEEGFTSYNGVPVIKLPFGGNVGFSAGAIFLGNGVKADAQGVATLMHEYGHVVHLSQIGWESYVIWVLIPSVTNFHRGVPYADYYSQPWEYIADTLGGVERTNGNQPYEYSPNAQQEADEYYQFTLDYVGLYPFP